MPNLNIIKNYYGDLTPHPVRMPRERFVRFYRDLYERLELEGPDPSSFQSGSQHTYAELGDAVLKQCEADGILKDLELLMVCSWTPEFDPEHSAGAYFCSRYGITGKTLDICDQGILSPIMAIKIINSYFNHGDISNALLLCIDQTTIPVPKNSLKNRPKKSSALGIFIKKGEKSKGIDFIHAKISPDRDALFFAGKISKAAEYNVGFMTTDFPYLNCAEVLRPIIYQESIKPREKSHFMLTISDIESLDYGFLLGRY